MAQTTSPLLNYQSPDLTRHPPRSPRVRLGGYVHLPRLLDKARAFGAARNGGYDFNCPLDRTFFEFTGIGPEEFLAEVKRGSSDTDMLAWVIAHTRRGPSEVAAWSALRETFAPGDAGSHGWFAQTIQAAAPKRDDIRTFFDLLDLDDFASFGGRA
jgi:hypothetical protein